MNTYKGMTIRTGRYFQFSWKRGAGGTITIHSLYTGLQYYWMNGHWNRGGRI
jgi:hypothetical protein